jgi:protein SCO1/2
MPSIRIAVAALTLLFPALPGRAAEAAPPPGVAASAFPGAPFIAGHFRLASPDGAVVDSDDLSGKPYVVFFGFTHCPDLCPTTLSELSTALARLPAGDLRIYFVSVDPERDDPAALAQYMSNFDPRIVALTGTRSAVEEATASFGAVARRTDSPDGGYTYSHTAAILLIDGDGLIVDRIGADVGAERLARRLAALSGAAAPSR